MARVNVETRALAEHRFYNLMTILKFNRPETIGLLVLFWHDSQECGVWKGSRQEVEKFIPYPRESRSEIFNALIDQDYISECENNEFLIHGNKKHIEAIENKKNAGSAGGKAKAKKVNEIKASLAHASGVLARGRSALPNTIQYNAVQFSALQNNSIQKKEEYSPERSVERIRAVAAYSSLETVFQERKVTEKIQLRWQAAFPDSEWVVEQINKALAWEDSNPTRRKKNFPAFITRWLTKGWDFRKTEGVQSKRDYSFLKESS